MALLFLEGFEEYDSSSSNNFATDYSQAQAVNGVKGSYFYVNTMIPVTSPARTAPNGVTGKSMRLFDSVFGWSIPSTATTLIFGVAIYVGLPTSSKTMLGFCRDVGGNYLTTQSGGVRIVVNNGGTISLINGSAVTLATSTLTLPNNTWFYLEMKYTFGSGTSGSCQIKVDETDFINVTSVDTAGGVASINSFYFQSNGVNYYFDDVYMCDSTGTANNGFLGPIGVYTMVPTANASVAMTASAGSNYACVDEIPGNTSDYVTATALNQLDLYNFSGFPSGFTASVVPGVLMKSKSMKASANSGQVQQVTNYSGSTAYSSNYSVSQGTWGTNSTVFETQPDGSPWSQAAIAGLAAGVKVV